MVFVLLLQIKIGERTLDEKIQAGIQSSHFAEPIEETVRGGVLMVEHGYRKFLSLFNQSLKEKINQDNAPGNRFKMPELRRQAEEIREDVEGKTKETAKKFRDRLMSEDESY
tara:strand:- start:3428 stop:3763 length:336 start_codon:yes stop_codon:yes gene_type:complete